MADENFMSPGAAIARQARTERSILLTVEKTAKGFLSLSASMALSRGLQLSPSAVSELWQDSVRDSIWRAPYLSAEAAAYVLEGLLASDFPDDVYLSARAVMTTAAEQGHSYGQMKTELRKALDLNSATVTAEVLEAAGFWDGLTATGNRWISKIRTLVRTTTTGLDGWVTQTGLQVTGVPYKQWVSRHDEFVRHSHSEADGQTVPVDTPFMVGGQSLMHPGDRMATIEEVVNCRCVMVGVLRGA